MDIKPAVDAVKSAAKQSAIAMGKSTPATGTLLSTPEATQFSYQAGQELINPTQRSIAVNQGVLGNFSPEKNNLGTILQTGSYFIPGIGEAAMARDSAEPFVNWDTSSTFDKVLGATGIAAVGASTVTSVLAKQAQAVVYDAKSGASVGSGANVEAKAASAVSQESQTQLNNQRAIQAANEQKLPFNQIVNKYPAEEANAQLPKYTEPVPYTPGTTVTEFKPVNYDAEYGRTFSSIKGNEQGRFVGDLDDILKQSVNNLGKDYVINNPVDSKTKVTIPQNTLIRTGEVNGSPGKTQFDIVEYDNLTPEQKSKMFKTIKE